MSNIIDLQRKRIEHQVKLALGQNEQALFLIDGKLTTGLEVLGQTKGPAVSMSDSLKRISESIRQINELCNQLKIDPKP